jgi:phosphotransferase system HPr (HPr) family protein
MTEDAPVMRRQVEIRNPDGFHMRPASRFAVLANRYSGVRVVLRRRGEEVNGKSMLDLTMLAADRGDLVELEVEGPGAEEALEALAAILGAESDEADEPPGGAPA